METKAKEKKLRWETVQVIRLKPGQEVHIKPGNPIEIEVRERRKG